jgi:hypothetical protein
MRLSEYLRLAQRAHEEGSLPYRRRIAALKEENRILRAKAGWEPASESENSDDEDDVFDEGIEVVSAWFLHVRLLKVSALIDTAKMQHSALAWAFYRVSWRME